MKNWLRYAARVAATLVFAALVYGVLFAITENVGQNRADEASVAERAELRHDLEQNEAAVQLLTDQLESLGQEPVVEPPSSTTPTIAPGGGTPSIELLRSLIRFAVESACGGPSCRGLDGQPGAEGADGADGLDGKDGTPGANGANGADGAPGAPGRGIVSGPTCQEDGTWTTTYTDGSVETQPGPCRFIPAPPTEPEPPLEPAA